MGRIPLGRFLGGQGQQNAKAVNAFLKFFQVGAAEDACGFGGVAKSLSTVQGPPLSIFRKGLLWGVMVQ